MDSINTILNNTTKEKEPGKMQACKYCGKPYVWYEKELFSGAQKRVLKVQVPDCKCIEEREKQQEDQIKMRKLAEKQAKLFENSLMTTLFKDKTFENLLKEENLLKYNNALTIHKCQEYARQFKPKESYGIQMIGNPGTAKTTLLAAICNELMRKNYSCLFTTLSNLIDKFASYSYEHAGNITPLLNWLTTFDFVVLDDIGRETYSDKRKELVFRIVDTLLNNKVVTCFSANPECITKLKSIPELSAVIDRLKDMCRVSLEFKGKSLRGR